MAGWQKTKIGEFLFERDGRYKPNDPLVANLKRIAKIDFSGNFHIAQKHSRTDMILVCPGDFVISGINVAKGAMGIYNGEEDVAATIHYSSYTFDTEKINVEYFKRFLRSDEFIRLLKEQVKGGIKTEIKPKHILLLEIDLPDLAEQEKILTHFQSIETEDTELKTEISHQVDLIKKLRQRILQEAIEGKLTADWRKANPDVEPASELLKRIQAEKAQLITEKKIRKQKEFPPIGEDEIPFTLPQGWVWDILENLLVEHPRNGYSSKPVDYKTNIRRLTLSATTSGKFIPKHFKYVDIEVPDDSHLWLQPNDILIQRSNSIELVGSCAIYDGKPKEFTYPDLIMKMKASQYMSVKYLHTAISSEMVKKYFREKAVGSSPTMKKINQKTIQKTLVPVPPLAEQNAIVAKVEKLLALYDQLETEISANQKNAASLLQAVLREAFSQDSK